MQPLCIGQDRVTRRAEKILVPDSDEAEQHGKVACQRRVAKVLVEIEGAIEQRAEVSRAEGDRYGEAHRGPEGVPPADPVPDTEAVFPRNAEAVHRRIIHRHRKKMPRQRGLRQLLQQPAAGGVGVELSLAAW